MMDKILNNIFYIIFTAIIIVSALCVATNPPKLDHPDYNIKFYENTILKQIRKILIKIIFVLLVLLIANYIYVSTFFSGLMQYVYAFKQWVKENTQIFSPVVGALCASLLGIMTQVAISINNKRKDQIKYSRLLYNDLNYTIKKLELYCSTTNLHKDNNSEVFEKLARKISFDSRWREYYSYLTDKLSNIYYDKIVELYNLVERVNLCIDNKNINQYIDTVEEFRRYDKKFETIAFRDIDTISYADLLEAFYKLKKNKNVRPKLIRNLIKEIKIKEIKEKYSSMIENKIYALVDGVTDSKEQDSNFINKKVSEYLKSNIKDFKNMDYNDMHRIILEVSLKSKKIDLVWGYYFTADEKNESSNS
ncbi:hypothetical protein [Clostridium sp.]|uniref:hypothetical protein n=1 Tax=Clostridium sp. TaxID=1506 RepID=UPI0028491175|nr:hypothetical protein [Clostridium sp.]MDR3597056.1 hypothetical protein [Clostridium sp.]